MQSGPHLLDRHALTTEGEADLELEDLRAAAQRRVREASGGVGDSGGHPQGQGQGVCRLQGGRLHPKDGLFSRQQVSRFVIYAPALGELEQIRISHNSGQHFCSQIFWVFQR